MSTDESLASSTNQTDDENPSGIIDASMPEEEHPWLGIAQFHSNETLAMLQRFEQIENLIRLGHHSETEGNFCEHLVRVFLRETLPTRYSIDTGFILGHQAHVPWKFSEPPKIRWKQTTASPQLDIIIHDTDNYAPVLRTGEFVIVLPDAVRGVIEVKKRLTSGSLLDALWNLAATRYLMSQWTRDKLPFCAAFVFEASDEIVPSQNSLSKTYENRYNEICNPFSPAYAIPDLLVVARHLFLGRVLQTDYAFPLEVNWGLAENEGVNISGQLLLWHLMKRLQLPEVSSRVKRFQWPEDYPMGGQLKFDNPAEARAPLPDPE